MPERPWDKFYYSDWQSDQALGACGLAARGLWLEMLAIMHRADPRGHLLVNGKPPTSDQLAALARAPSDQIPGLLDELERAGVFSRTRNGVVYSRRMTRDEKRRKDGERAAKQGTIPGSRRSRKPTDKDGKNPPPPGGKAGVADRPPRPPDTRGQRPERKKEGYAWEGRIGRLTRADYDDWRQTFAALDEPAFRRELMRADAFYADAPPKGGKWFWAFFKWLERANEDAQKRGGRPRPQASDWAKLYGD